jgi:hypothetical protein
MWKQGTGESFKKKNKDCFQVITMLLLLLFTLDKTN